MNLNDFWFLASKLHNQNDLSGNCAWQNSNHLTPWSHAKCAFQWLQAWYEFALQKRKYISLSFVWYGTFFAIRREVRKTLNVCGSNSVQHGLLKMHCWCQSSNFLEKSVGIIMSKIFGCEICKSVVAEYVGIIILIRLDASKSIT